MAELLTPPIDPYAKTVIDLDYGQQIIIDKDTHFSRIQSRLNDPNPATSIKLEPFGTCWSFTLEDGVWWHNEYIGDAQRNPQLQKKIRATEEERVGREQARREWEERAQRWDPNPGLPLNPLEAPPSYYDQASRTNGFQDTRRFPGPAVNFVHIQQNAQANSSPTPHFSANTTNHPSNFGPPPFIHQSWGPPQHHSFPPSFPFISDPPSNYSGTPSQNFPTPSLPQPPSPSYHTFRSSRRQMPKANHVNGIHYVKVDGNTKNFYVDQSANVVGNNNNVNWIW